MSTNSDVAVVVLNWNGWDDTRECLQSLREVTAGCRVLLVDNGSTDGSVAYARTEFPEVEVVENGANLGFTEGNNRGIERALAAGAGYVMLLNNDTIVDPGFLEPLLGALERGGLGFASPLILYADEPDLAWFCGGEIDWRTGWAYHRKPDDYGRPEHGISPTPIATGCCVIASRETWEDVGLLDERFFLFWEDADWTLRATRSGHPGGVVDDSRIWHKVSRSFTRGEPTLGTFYFVRNGLLFIRKHRPRRPLVALRFIWAWVLRPSLREAKRREHAWPRMAALRIGAVLAYLTRSFGVAPRYAVRVAGRRRAPSTSLRNLHPRGPPTREGLSEQVTRNPLWPHLYLAYQERVPNHPGKRTLTRLMLRAISRLRPRPFLWRMHNGARIAISPLEGLMPFGTVGWTCLHTGVFGVPLERCLRERLRPGDVALDVGANLGYYTAVMAQTVGPSGRVHSFEPVPPTFERLRVVPEANGFEQVTMLPIALGAFDGKAEVSYDPHNTGWATLHGRAQGHDPATASVEIRTLDSLVAAGEVPLPQLIKIDVEGHELEVLRGARRTIAKAKPIILFELNQAMAARAGWSMSDVSALLSSCGYEFAVIEEDRLAPMDPTRHVLEPDAFVDVLATPLPVGNRDA